MDSSSVATWEEQLCNNSELELFKHMEDCWELVDICGDKTIADFVDFVIANVKPDRPDLVREDHIFYPNLLLEFLHKLSPDENIDKDSIFCKCTNCEATLGDEDNMFRGHEGLCNTCHTHAEPN